MIDRTVRIACGYSAIIVVASAVNKPKCVTQINRQSALWNVNTKKHTCVTARNFLRNGQKCVSLALGGNIVRRSLSTSAENH